MARYNREFLVPYLENLCALHIARWKVENKSKEIANRQISINREMNMLKQPERPTMEDTGPWTGGLVMGIIFIIVSFFDIFIISFLAGLLGWIMAISSGIFLYKASLANEDKEYTYDCEVNDYNRKLKELQKDEDDYATYAFVQCSLCQAEKDKVDVALQKAYSANIIPRRYRDIYVAVYLYDWFSTSMADDLDMALNMYVLEEIKDRLDSIIDQLAKSLLNQRTIIDNQKKSMQQQEQYRNEMLGKLERLQVTAEEHTRYLGMIEANTAAAAYFSAAKYIREI